MYRAKDFPGAYHHLAETGTDGRGGKQKDWRVTSRVVSIAPKTIGRGGSELDGRGLLRAFITLCAQYGRDGGRQVS